MKAKRSWFVKICHDSFLKKVKRKTLQLLSDLAVGYATVRKLIKLDSVKQLLHSHQDFPFLRIQDGFDNKSQIKRLKVCLNDFSSVLTRNYRVERASIPRWVDCLWLNLERTKRPFRISCGQCKKLLIS